ncbi:PAS domain S-box protein [Acidithiobacillus caldus]|uniref:PAS domain S-box protein n=1 Tax=Acidithiobacillus caldus TaxID=33059 RepID=UPI000570B1C6|nr:PAS domain S-box protein [Acidithiobacillus caldus]MBU2734239.1 PAS domain S-box protein [Acidithiobacillus caldus ATCC 51756]MBU2746085.1 PAS domain S-box protein [Acidithiobacillus caldus]MBU2779660.1 PAS domain S-box protein [Acidithiobacillus caldus]
MNLQNIDNTTLQQLWQSIDRASAIIAFTPNGTILDANGNFLQAAGYTHSELIGQPLDTLRAGLCSEPSLPAILGRSRCRQAAARDL